MRELARRKRARVVAVVALVVALVLGVAVPVAAETPATVLPANPPTCTAKALGVPRASNPGLAADCDTLLAIQSTLRVSGWINYDAPSWWDHSYALNWLAIAPLKHWRAVTLGGTPQRVVGLDFSDTRESVRVFNARTRQWETPQPFTREWTLRGVIPTQLGNLTALETLDLGGSELTGSVPTQLGALTKLTRLDLGDNKLTGAIPTQLGSLTALTSLDLSDNALSGGLPAGLRNLPPTLATLRLAGNAVTGCLDERLRLATTNDLATLRKERGLSWCPVALVSGDGLPFTPGETYQIFRERIIVDIPSTGPRIQLFSLVSYSGDPRESGVAYCFSDVKQLKLVCIDGITGEEWSRGSIAPYRRDAYRHDRGSASGASSTPTPPAGLDAAFDALVVSARPAP